jgi:hypothetical protein
MNIESKRLRREPDEVMRSTTGAWSNSPVSINEATNRNGDNSSSGDTSGFSSESTVVIS